MPLVQDNFQPIYSIMGYEVICYFGSAQQDLQLPQVLLPQWLPSLCPANAWKCSLPSRMKDDYSHQLFCCRKITVWGSGSVAREMLPSVKVGEAVRVAWGTWRHSPVLVSPAGHGHGHHHCHTGRWLLFSWNTITLPYSSRCSWVGG